MLSEYHRLEQNIQQLKQIIQSYPQQQLICNANGSYYKWFVRSKGQRKQLLTKKHRPFAELLAQKQYYVCQLKDSEKELEAIKAYLLAHNSELTETEKLLTEQPEFQKLLKSHFQPLASKQLEWMNSPYQRNPSHPEKLIIKSCSGNIVRSKSEALIDTLLFTKHIAFRYECALTLGNLTIYPDFTIMHPITGEIYYWEHFGLMDKEEYAQHAADKLRDYIAHGIFPSIRLIITSETQANPLTPSTIESIIAQYFT